MKKLMALLMALALMLSLAACGGSSGSGKIAERTGGFGSSTEETQTAEPEEEESEEPEAPEESEEPEVTEAPAEPEMPEEPDEIERPSSDKDVTFTEMTVVDNEYCSIKITGVDPDNDWGFTVNAEFENKSADTEYFFNVVNGSLNGVTCDPFFGVNVPAGKKSVEEISYYDDETLIAYGITEFTDACLIFQVYDSNDYSADDVAYETVHIYPYGEENATPYQRPATEGDIVLIDNEYATVIVIGTSHDEYWGYGVELYLVNKVDAEVMFSADDASVNGYMIDPYWADTVMANSSAFGTMYFDDEDLEKSGITDVEEIELTMTVYNNDDWSIDDYVEETVVFNP